jgi:murein DD-endopeptidase MepM/ murein hydrolase activator NlpD
MAAASLASAAAACSSDTSRFGDSPFTNPFSAAPTSQVDRTATGSLPTRSSPIGSVTSQPLPPTVSRGPVVNPLNSAQRITSPVGAAQPLPRVASATLQQASPIGGSAAGWSAAGGTPVTVGAGDTANTLSARYGVPVAAITAANGGQVRPGQAAIIPVFTGGAAKAGVGSPAPTAAAPAAPAVPVASAPKAGPIIAAAKPLSPVKAAKPADDDDEDETPAKKIIAAAPAKPLGNAKAPAAVKAPAKPADDDDDEDETPKKQAEKPAQPASKAQARVIPLAPQVPAKVAEAPKVDQTTTQSIAPAQTAAKAEDKPEFRWPAKGRVISGFGSKGGNGDGIAIAVPEGTPVKAAEGGTVAYAGEELKGYGKLVLVRHDNGFVSAYAHNGELNVKRGEKVSRGQQIAKSGSTGNVTSPQLHFELRKGSTPVDPTKYLDN